MEHWPLHQLRGGTAHHLLISFFVLWTPKPEQSSPGTSRYSLVSQHTIKSRRLWHTGPSEGKLWLVNFQLSTVNFWTQRLFPQRKGTKEEYKHDQIIHITIHFSSLNDSVLLTFSVTSTDGSLTRASEKANHNWTLRVLFLYDNIPIFDLLLLNIISACLQVHRNNFKSQ